MEQLATKYRPRKFEDIVSQDNVKIILKNQLETGLFKQAYLFCGGAGTGKTTSARIFANEINGGNAKPVEIDGASNNGVDNIRELIENCRMKAIDGSYKVYIIDEVHMLSTGAFNALLKILEEPPAKVIFILCTTDPQKIPATILSRVQRFNFTRIPNELIVDRLEYIIQQENEERVITNGGSRDALHDEHWAESEGIAQIFSERAALNYIASLAGGGMRDAITKLDTILGYGDDITIDTVTKCLGITPQSIMLKLIEAIKTNNIAEGLKLVDELYMGGKDLKLFIKDFAVFVLDIIKLATTGNSGPMSEPCIRKVQQVINGTSSNFLLELLEQLNILSANIKYEQNPKFLVESEVLRLCNTEF